jgi:foldase protein PrsA
MLHNKRKAWKVGASALLALTLLAGCGKGEGAGTEKIVALYDGGEVTQTEYDSYVSVNSFLNPMYGEYYKEPGMMENNVKQLVAQEILSSRAEVGDEQTEKAKESYSQLKASFTEALGSDEEFVKRMEEAKVTEEQVIVYFAQLGAVEKYFRDKLSEEAVQSEYEQNKGSFTKATVSHILIKTDTRTKEEALKLATDIKKKLDAGEDFAKLAKQHSEDPGSKDNGGTYENADVSGWVPEFKDAALTLTLNTISEPVETQFGYHIMKVTERTVPELTAIREQVELEVMQRDFTAFMETELPELIKEIKLTEEAKKAKEEQQKTK